MKTITLCTAFLLTFMTESSVAAINGKLGAVTTGKANITLTIPEKIYISSPQESSGLCLQGNGTNAYKVHIIPIESLDNSKLSIQQDENAPTCPKQGTKISIIANNTINVPQTITLTIEPD